MTDDRTTWWWGLGVFVLAAAGGAWWWWQGRTPPPQPLAQAPAPEQPVPEPPKAQAVEHPIEAAPAALAATGDTAPLPALAESDSALRTAIWPRRRSKVRSGSYSRKCSTSSPIPSSMRARPDRSRCCGWARRTPRA